MDASPCEGAWDVLVVPECMLRPARGSDGCCALVWVWNGGELPVADGVGMEKMSSSMGAAEEAGAAEGAANEPAMVQMIS